MRSTNQANELCFSTNGQFDIVGWWVGGVKKRLKTISAQLKLELRAELGKIHQGGKRDQIYYINDVIILDSVNN